MLNINIAHINQRSLGSSTVVKGVKGSGEPLAYENQGMYCIASFTAKESTIKYCSTFTALRIKSRERTHSHDPSVLGGPYKAWLIVSLH